jgi:hypothetical protein
LKARLQASVFTPLTALITKGEWSKTIEDQLLGYLDEEYLTTVGLGNSRLGHNLHIVADAMSIVKILGFKTINAAIQEIGSTNYAPVAAFIENNLELTTRIVQNHEDYFANSATLEIYETIKASALEQAALEQVALEKAALEQATLEQAHIVEDGMATIYNKQNI